MLELESFVNLSAITNKFPQQMQGNYYWALSFSDFILVARKLYNIMVSNEQNQKANEVFELLKEEMADSENPDIDTITDKLYIFKTDIKNFLKQLQTCMLNVDVEGMRKATKALKVMLKGANRAKTAHLGEFNNEESHGSRELHYRFYNAKTILKDIFESARLIDVKFK